MQYSFKTATDKNVWENFNLGREPQSFLQSWYWGEVNELTGDKAERFFIYHAKELVGLIQLIQQDAKRGPHHIIPAGPIIDWSNNELVNQTFTFIKEHARQEGAWFVRVRPEAVESDQLKSIFANHGLVSAPMHLHGENTLVLDLLKSDEELLTEMRKNTRYDIRKSLSEGYKFRISNNEKTVDVLHALQLETAKRAGFVEFSRELFAAEVTVFSKNTKSFLAICEKGGKALAVAIIVVYGNKGYYHFSGSSDKARNTRASYFLQWQIIQKLKTLGVAKYDLWGVARPGVANHRFAGVTTFKTGFGGTQTDWLHAHDLVISPKYYLTRIFEELRKRARRL